MTKDEIEKKVIEIVSHEARTHVSRGDEFCSRLSLDDFEVLDIARELVTEFDIDIDDHHVWEWMTVGDAIDCITAKLGVTA